MCTDYLKHRFPKLGTGSFHVVIISFPLQGIISNDVMVSHPKLKTNHEYYRTVMYGSEILFLSTPPPPYYAGPLNSLITALLWI